MSFLMYLLVIVVVSAALVIAVVAEYVSVKDALGWFAPLIATFTGALFAFRLQEYKERIKIKEDRKKSLNEALFVLAARYNELSNVRKSLEPYRELPEEIRALSLPAMMGTDLSALRFSFKDLVFLARVSSPEILLDLLVEESRFDAAIETLKIRAEQHAHVLQPAMAEHGVGKGLWTAERLESVLGEFLFRSAITNTNQVFDHVYRSLDSCLAVSRNLHGVAKQLYGSEKFIVVSPPD